MALTEAQRERYHRHLILDGVTEESVERLLSARVLVVGAGGLGSFACYYLAAAGVGQLGIMDHDVVDISNLQRQMLYSMDSLGRDKVVAAKERLEALNPDVRVRPIKEELAVGNVGQVIPEYDFVVAATDNMASKYLINDFCVMVHKPLSYGGANRFKGRTMTVLPPESACYRCYWPTISQKRGEVVGPFGVLAPLPGVVGAIQAQECIKHFLRVGTLLTDRLLQIDALESRMESRRVEKDPDCPVCGTNPVITSLEDYERQVSSIPYNPPVVENTGPRKTEDVS